MDHGEILGEVELELSDGVVYKGELDEWEPRKTGELVYPNGRVFNGTIDLDLMGGFGELIKEDGSIVKGKIVRGELV